MCVFLHIHNKCTQTYSPATFLGTPVQLLGNKSNQPITWQQLHAFSYLDVVKTTC